MTGNHGPFGLTKVGFQSVVLLPLTLENEDDTEPKSTTYTFSRPVLLLSTTLSTRDLIGMSPDEPVTISCSVRQRSRWVPRVKGTRKQVDPSPPPTDPLSSLSPMTKFCLPDIPFSLFGPWTPSLWNQRSSTPFPPL